jgi:hypothetical protein
MGRSYDLISDQVPWPGPAPQSRDIHHQPWATVPHISGLFACLNFVESWSLTTQHCTPINDEIRSRKRRTYATIFTNNSNLTRRNTNTLTSPTLGHLSNILVPSRHFLTNSPLPSDFLPWPALGIERPKKRKTTLATKNQPSKGPILRQPLQ